MTRGFLFGIAAGAALASVAGAILLVTVFRPGEEVFQPTGNQALLEGTWTQVYSESEGDFFSSVDLEKQLAQLSRLLNSGIAIREIAPPARYVPHVVKVSKGEIATGRDGPSFPDYRYSYTLDPAGKVGAIDWVVVEERWPGRQPKRMEGIYRVEGDFLIWCFNLDGGPRPERFTTSKKPKTALSILRRGKLTGEEPPQPKKVYKYKEDLNRLVVVYRFPRTYVCGYLDATGKFSEDPTYAPKKDINEVPLSWMAHGIINLPRWSSEPVYEYRSGMLVEGILRDSGDFAPTPDKTPIAFKDYQYDPGARRIYNLPGEFVPMLAPAKQNAADSRHGS